MSRRADRHAPDTLIEVQRPLGLRAYLGWVAIGSVVMAFGLPVVHATHEFGWDPSTPVYLRPIRFLGLVLASLAWAGAQLLVLGPHVRSRRVWLAMSVLGWGGAVVGPPIATIGFPGDTPIAVVAIFVSLLGGGFLGVCQLPALHVDGRAAWAWLTASTLAGPALAGGFALAERWEAGEIAAGALGGFGYGIVSGLGLRFLPRRQDARTPPQLTGAVT